MKPPPFKYHAPATLPEALELMGQYGYDAKVLAGGQSLVPTMNFRLSNPSVLIDLNRIPDMAYIDAWNGGLSIGAMTRHVQVEKNPKVLDKLPLLYATMPKIAHPQIRNRGTFGGSLAHADPAAELPALLRAVRGKIKVQSARGERWIDADDFFVDFFTTALQPEEVLTEVRLPGLPARSGWAVDEVSRRHGDFALVGVTTMVRVNANGACDEARMVFFGVGGGPVLAETAAGALRGEQPTQEAILAAAEVAAEKDVDPPTDVHATAAYRRHLVKVLAKRTLQQAFDRALGKEVAS